MDILAAMVAASSIFLLVVYVIRARALNPSNARLRYLSPSREVHMDLGGGTATFLKRPSRIPVLSKLLSTSNYAARWTFELDRANLRLRVGEYFLLRLVVASMTLALTMLIGRSVFAFLIALLLGWVAFMVPAYWLSFYTRRRISKINAQLVETVTLITSSVRAGFAFSQSIAMAAQRMPDPISTELNRMLLDVNLGASTEDALAGMNARIGSDDVDMVITAILIQRNSGGNLAEVLDNVTETMRERERMEGEIKTLTSSQRATAWVLTLWPVVLGLLFFAISPTAMSLMWTTGVGIALLIIWAVLTMMAAFTYRRILAIDV